MRGVHYWEVILKRLLHLGLNILSAFHGMFAIWDVRYWEVSLYYHFSTNSIKYLKLLFYIIGSFRPIPRP